VGKSKGCRVRSQPDVLIGILPAVEAVLEPDPAHGIGKEVTGLVPLTHAGHCCMILIMYGRRHVRHDAQRRVGVRAMRITPRNPWSFVLPFLH
jgi:hypothetical protein